MNWHLLWQIPAALAAVMLVVVAASFVYYTLLYGRTYIEWGDGRRRTKETSKKTKGTGP